MILQLTDVCASYGATQALFGVNLSIAPGQVVALLGRNGMGKSTTIKVISRLLTHHQGTVVFAGQDLAALTSFQTARLGIGLCPEGRRIFTDLTVLENLNAAARPGHWSFASVSKLFPRLAERRDQNAATLSGGEQQMLAIARALMTNPALLLLDEATEGLAPVVRQEIWASVEALKSTGDLSLLIVDKSLSELSHVADTAFVLERGLTVWSGSFYALTTDVTERYLGI